MHTSSKQDNGLSQTSCLSADTLHTITYLSYHLYIRLQLIIHCTQPLLLRLIEPKVTQSIAAIEEASARLNVVQPGGGIKEIWDVTTRTVSSYIASEGKYADNSLANSAICEAVELIDEELEVRYPSEASPMVSYIQNIQALIKYGIDGSQLESDHVIIYLNNERKLPRRCFSEVYLASVDHLHPLIELVHQRQLTVDELQKIHLTLVWQTENILTHFKSGGYVPGVLCSMEELPTDENQRIGLLQDTLVRGESTPYRGYRVTLHVTYWSTDGRAGRSVVFMHGHLVEGCTYTSYAFGRRVSELPLVFSSIGNLFSAFTKKLSRSLTTEATCHCHASIPVRTTCMLVYMFYHLCC